MRSRGNALLCLAFTLGLLEAYFVRAETKCGNFFCGACAADGDRCRACREGYTFDDGRTCVPCSDPLCARCGPPGACKACKKRAPAEPVPTEVPDFYVGDPYTVPVYMDKQGACRKCKAAGPCLACDSEGRCTRCPAYAVEPPSPAFMLTKAGCVMCRSFSCVRCDPSAPDRCLKCQGAADPNPSTAFVPFPSFVNPKTGSCDQCTKHPVLSGCAECSGRDGGDACQKCLPGYLLRAGQCVRCRDPLCIVCSGAKADKCQRCTDHDSDRSGYKPVFMGADGVCKKYNGTACMKVGPGGRCLECEPEECAWYTDSSGLRCQHGNLLDPSTGRCVSCEALTGDPHCGECTLQGACRRCTSDAGWMPAGLDGKRRCARCKDKRCEGCQADYRVCEACPEEDWSDWENVQRVYRDASGRCQLCTAPCFTCAPDGSCRSCIDGWRPDPAWPGKCVACAKGAGCISCFSPLCDECGADGTCARCTPGPDVGPTCRPCKAVPHCAECDAAGACVQCYDPDSMGSFGLDDSGGCRPCQDPLCVSCPTDYRTCQACRGWPPGSTYMDAGGRCRNCTQPRCLECAPDGNCAVCSEGYPHAGRCGRCTDPNCAYCPEDPARCEGCRGGGDMGDPGFFMDQQGLCHKCPWKGCVACNPDGSCAMCHSGYFKRQRWGVAAGGCSPCAKGQSCVRCQIEYEYLCSACTRRLGELECTACGGWAQGATSLLGFEFDKKCRLVRGPEPGR